MRKLFHVHFSPVVQWVALFLAPVMATKLFYTPGDPDYLKVVLLRDIFGVPMTHFETVEGEVWLKKFIMLSDWSC